MYAVLIAIILSVLVKFILYLLKHTHPTKIKKTQSLLGWQITMVIFSFAAVFFAINAPNARLGNFLYHLIGGGILSGLATVAIISNLKTRLHPLLISIIVFASVCSFGVLNELAEFGVENLGYATFTYDRHDTWRDLLANSVGGLLVAGIYVLIRYVADQQRKAVR